MKIGDIQTHFEKMNKFYYFCRVNTQKNNALIKEQMTKFQVNLQKDTEIKFMNILSSYSNEDTLFRNFINYQINELRRENINMLVDIDNFEKKYNITSEKFYQKYKKAETDDSHDTLLWIGLYESLIENKSKLKELKW